MGPTRVAIYINVARDGDSPAWLRIGTGRLRADGSLLARLVHLPADGRVRLQVVPDTGDEGDARAGAGAPQPPPRPHRASRRMPPPPAVRQEPARAQEETPW
jgi:hypothetical protein